MGGDIRFLQQLDFPAYAVELDWLMNDLGLIVDGFDLQSAIIVALGTDALAPPDQELPDPDATDRRGWWGDLDAQELWGGWPVGCLLWLLQRAKLTGAGARGGSTLSRADGWTRDAMQPFTENLIATRIDVFAETLDTNRIDVAVAVYRGQQPQVELRYSELWDDLRRGE
jgi:phage gp46-like protein